MKEPIVLTEAEIDAAMKVLQRTVTVNQEDRMKMVVNAINEVRTGDPVGTVRVNGTSTAVRRPYGWLLIHPDHCDERNDERSPVDVSGWKVVHRP